MARALPTEQLLLGYRDFGFEDGQDLRRQLAYAACAEGEDEIAGLGEGRDLRDGGWEICCVVGLGVAHFCC